MSVKVKRKFVFNDVVKNTFLEAVRRTGLIVQAARSAGTNSRRIKKECEDDKEFGVDFQEALMDYAESCQKELHRRAIDGVTEDVYFQGVVCGQKQNYSDALLTTLVKAKSPEFREKLSVDTTIHGGVLCVLPQAVSPEAWIEATKQAQLPAAPTEEEEENIIDAESTEPVTAE